MPKKSTLKVGAGIASSFLGLVAAIIFLSEASVISFEMAMLMLVALVGLCFGLGFLFVVYRFVSKLE